MTRQTGESAFPTTQYVNGLSPTGHAEGMTLRDYFAIRAPSPDENWKNRYARERGYRGEALMISTWNYEYADAMLEAREM